MAIAPGLEQRDRRLVAEPLDVEGAATGDVEDPLAHLGRALLVVGAAQVLVALLLLGQRGAAAAGHSVGHPTHSASPSGRSASTGPTISGITSPALRSIDGVARGRTSLRPTSWALCRVAFSTVEPATLVGSMTPYGVTRPVRPTLTSIVEEPGVDLLGRVLEGDRPARRAAGRAEPPLQRDVVDLDHDAVDLVADDGVAVLAGVLDVGSHLGRASGTTRTWSEVGRPQARSAS